MKTRSRGGARGAGRAGGAAFVGYAGNAIAPLCGEHYFFPEGAGQ